MVRIVVNVPDEKLAEFNEAISSLGYQLAEEEFEIPEAHKQIVLERIRNNSDEDYVSWQEVKNRFREKYGIGN